MITFQGNEMHPVPGGVHRGAFSTQPCFIGGQRDGQLAEAGRQPYRRSSSGQPLDDGQIPDDFYVLFRNDSGYLWAYIHSSILPTGHDSQSAEGGQ